MAHAIAELEIVSTSPTCTSYRLYATDGESLTAPRRLVWSNRVVPSVDGDAGARKRLAAWAAAHGYVVRERRKTDRRSA